MERSAGKPATPCILIIFGIAGDLMKRLLFPAICNLGSSGLISENFCIIGVSKEPFNTETFRQQITQDIDTFISDPAAKKYGLGLINRLHYLSGDFDDANTYQHLKNKFEELVANKFSKNILFYFAVPPQFIETIALHLDKAEMLVKTKEYFRRIIVEKPFGHDLASAKKLNKLLLSFVDEKQIFRIDHYLGKETVQNLLAFRFSNGLFEPVWNRFYIDNVQITGAEVLGVELRGNYYENAGALRDMIANHFLQMLSLIAMEPPSSFSAKNIRIEKSKVLSAAQRLNPEFAVRGQYGPGKVNDKKVPGYRAEKDVASNSNVETYVALKLFLNNWRWLGVPFYLRTGKRLAMQQTEILIQFKTGPSALFSESSKRVMPNILHLFIQPDQGISFRFNVKIPGTTMQLDQAEMKFKYSDYFGIKPQTGYETILYECMIGDHLLFNTADMVEAEWEIVQPLLNAWSEVKPTKFPNYTAGSWGPKEADDLLKKDGRKWQL